MAAMRNLLYIPFQFEDGGTRVIHYSPEEYTPRGLKDKELRREDR